MPRPVISSRIFVLILLAFGMILGASAETRPVSIDRADDGRIFVLTSNGSILRSKSGKLIGEFEVFAHLPALVDGIQIISRTLYSKPQVFVTASGSTTGDSGGKLIQFSARGELEATWALPGICAGLDTDSGEHDVYLAAINPGNVYSVHIPETPRPTKPKDVRVVATLKDAVRLGALVGDGRAQAYLADVLSGSLYRWEVRQNFLSVVANLLGQPVAVAINEHQRVFVADLSGKRILYSDVHDRIVPKPGVLIQSAEFEELSGLTISKDGMLLVADRGAAMIFVVDVSGRIVRRIGLGP